MKFQNIGTSAYRNIVISEYECRKIGISDFWNIGINIGIIEYPDFNIPIFLKFGISEYRNIRILEYQNFVIMEYWNILIFQYCAILKVGILEYRNCNMGILKYRSIGISEYWSIGI